MNNASLPPKGTHDIWGSELRFREHVISTIRSVYESFGFEALETPVIERESTLKGKYGDEAQNLIFWAPDYEVGLRYDHTVPLARFVANNQGKIKMPYRRYAIGPVFRGDNTQRGRERQFIQCDFDTVGSRNPGVDAEIVAINYAVLTALGFTNQFVIQINDRKLLNAMVREMGFTTPEQASIIMTAWDKLDKVSPQEVFDAYLSRQIERLGLTLEELREKYIETTEFLFSLQGKNTDEVLQALSNRFTSADAKDAISDLKNLLQMIDSMEIPKQSYRINPLLARGLSYYTGPIFETIITEGGIGSITGGGRFDNLIEAMGGPDIPASGSSFGLERLLVVMEELGLKKEIKPKTHVFVTVFDAQNEEIVLTNFKVAAELRKAGISTEIYSGDPMKLGKQLAIASDKRIPFVIIVGPDELAKSEVKIRDLQSGEETLVSVSEVASAIKQSLPNK